MVWPTGSYYDFSVSLRGVDTQKESQQGRGHSTIVPAAALLCFRAPRFSC